VKSFLIILCWFGWVGAAPTTEIKIDQVGYLPEAPKLAFVVSSRPASDFTVRRKRDDSIAYRGKLSEPVNDPDSNDQLQTAEFSNLKEHGSYYLDVPGVGRSWSFAIEPNVYSHGFYLSLRAFYGQRCGTAVDLSPDFPGYKHSACHLNGAFHPTSGRSGAHVSQKGWHDAGDYGRYVVNSGISTAELLWAWELFGPRVANIKLNIPESQNNTPDILDEVRWNLDWMLSMQDDDGGVWHKQTSENFAPFVMPENDKLTSYVIGTGKDPYKGSCATADFAAVMAIAARAYQPFDAQYAKHCLTAAEKAWEWLQKYPAVTFRNSNNVLTGGYGDNDCRDEIVWAAAELWRTTRNDAFERYFLDHFSEQLPTIRAIGPPAWQRVAPLGLWTYVLGGGTDRNAVEGIRQASLRAADEIVRRSNQNAYRTSMTTAEFVWGSNAVAANYGVQLLVTNVMKPDVRYKQTAAENLHYLLGRNTFSMSWVTQLGEHPFRHPHHRPSQADNNAEPWPGMLSGGPNQHRQDPAMKKLGNLPPAKMYLDDWESYATNEIAINWNAPLVFLFAGLLPEK
jgi:endoglucanase